MQLSAQLCAGKFILPDAVGSEMHFDRHAGNKVLLEAQGRHPEAVNYVLRSQNQLNRTVDGYGKRSHHRIVRAVWIRRVESDEVTGLFDKSRIRTPKQTVLTRVVEVPGELLCHHLDLV